MATDSISELIKACIRDPSVINTLSDEVVEQVTKKITLYGSLSYRPKNEYTCFSITNLRESYIKRLLMHSIIGYIYRALDEYNGADNNEKEIITAFLNSLFEFNPDYHVKKFGKETSTSASSNATSSSSLRFNNVPADTFYRIDKYMDVNYDSLRSIVEKLYPEKPDFDYVINVYDTFPDLTEANVFTDKFQDQFIHDVHTIKNNHWTFLGPFKENRDKIKFYNDNTTQLQSILEQVESDQKLGKDLLKKRVTNEKRRNVRTCGPHDSNVGSVMGNVDTLSDAKDSNDMSLSDDPYLRVDVFENDGVDLKKTHFYTEAVKPTKTSD